MAYVVDLRNMQPEPASDNSPIEAPEIPESTPTKEISSSPPLGLEWEAPEYLAYEKQNDWYWALGILVTGLLIVAVIMKNLLFGIFILIAGFTLALFAARKPRVVRFSLTPEGLLIEEKLYPYNTLRSFWIFYDPPLMKELSIETHRSFNPHIKVPLGDMNPVEVREYVKKFLPERRQEESLVELVSHILKF